MFHETHQALKCLVLFRYCVVVPKTLLQKRNFLVAAAQFENYENAGFEDMFLKVEMNFKK